MAEMTVATGPVRRWSKARPSTNNGGPVIRWGLRALVIAYVFLLVAWPTSLVVKETFSQGLDGIKTGACPTRT